MRTTFISPALLAVVLCLVAGAAIAGECKPVNVRIGPADWDGLTSCSALGQDFDFCLDSPITGTLNGTWHYYNVDENGMDIPVADPYPSSTIWWALGAIETNRGEIYVQDISVVNWDALDAIPGTEPAVAIENITGGTGRYEGAWGWFGVIFDNLGDWRGWARGVICTP